MLLKQLLYLREIARTQSLTAAGSNLFVAQQTLSAAIKNLEAELQTTLLNRSHSGVTLTSEGEYVLKAAEQILAIVDDLQAHFAPDPAEESSGEIKMMLSAGLRQTAFPQLFSHYYKNHRQVTLQARDAAYADIEKALLAGQIDIGLVTLPQINQHCLTTPHCRLRFVPLDHQRLAACVNSASPLAQYRSTTITTLLKYPLIMRPFQPLAQYPLYQILCQYGQPQVILADTAALVRQMLSDNNGVALTLAAEHTDLPAVVSLKIRDNAAVVFGYLLRADDEPNALLADCIAHLHAIFHIQKAASPLC